jgi:beta-phosphoglucomutase-like phosphatase (HAD superfamily)
VHGVTAAKAAGMVAIAVPGVLTRSHDLSRADLLVGSVADLTVPRLRTLVV